VAIGKGFQVYGNFCLEAYPGEPRGDGLDGHAWWPLFSATPIEYFRKTYYPVLVESYRP